MDTTKIFCHGFWEVLTEPDIGIAKVKSLPLLNHCLSVYFSDLDNILFRR